MTQASGDGGNFPNWSNDGATLSWSLGATLFSASVDDLFAVADEEGEGGFEAPTVGVSMSMRFDADVPSTVVALTGARIVTMSDSEGGVIENGVIVVDGNRISAVGASGDVTIPEGAQQVDVTVNP